MLAKLKNISGKIVEGFLIVLLIVMCVVLIAQILFRRTSTPLIWSEELSRYLFVWITFLGLGYGINKKSHIRFDSLILKLPTKIALTIQIAVNLFIMACYLYITPSMMTYCAAQHKLLSVSLHIPLTVYVAAAPVGVFFLLLFLAIEIIEIIGQMKSASSHDNKSTDI